MTRLTFSAYTARLREFIRGQTVPSNALGGPAAARVEATFNQMALALFELQFSFNKPYQRFCQAQGVSPTDVSDWRSVPAIPATGFKELELSSLSFAERETVFHSSGTTGSKPSRHFHHAESLKVYEASLLPWFQTNLLAVGAPMPMVFLTPSPALALNSSLIHMFESVRREFAAPGSDFVGLLDEGGGWIVDSARAREEFGVAEKIGRPIGVLGTAFSFVHLLDDLGRSGGSFHLPAGSWALETGGYKGRSRALAKSELHSLITERLGIPSRQIISEYGMSELSSQAYDHKIQRAAPSQGEEQTPRRIFRFPPWARVRLMSPETGLEVAESETGLIRVLDLANIRSVQAIQTEDLGIRRGGGFELVGRAALAEPRGCSLMVA